MEPGTVLDGMSHNRLLHVRTSPSLSLSLPLSLCVCVCAVGRLDICSSAPGSPVCVRQCAGLLLRKQQYSETFVAI